MNKEQKELATLENVITILQQNQKTLDEIRIWTKINGIEKVQNILNNALDTPEKRIVYHLSEGKTTREINTICGISIDTVSNYWNGWNRLGLMKTINVKGGGERFIKIFDLEHYGIEIPSITKKESKPKTTSVEKNQTEQQSVEGEKQNEQQ